MYCFRSNYQRRGGITLTDLIPPQARAVISRGPFCVQLLEMRGDCSILLILVELLTKLDAYVFNFDHHYLDFLFIFVKKIIKPNLYWRSKLVYTFIRSEMLFRIFNRYWYGILSSYNFRFSNFSIWWRQQCIWYFLNSYSCI